MNNKETLPMRFKDNVFCMLFRDKKNLLELYNALNDTDYTNVDDLAVTTLQGGVYMKYKNDASFVFGQDLYMFEQQASMNPNMPLRFLHYVSDVYREMYPNSELHRRAMLKIPVPHFVTFYNGRDGMKDEEIVLKLSDMYIESKDSPRKDKADCGMSDDSVTQAYTMSEPELELKVRVININPNCGEEADNGTPADSQSRKAPAILNKCHTLRDYMTFVNKVNEKKYSENKNIRTAVTEAVDECIASGVLSDFFSEYRDEVIDVSVYDYDEEGRMRVEREEGREEGDIRRLITQITKKVQKGMDIDTIASELEEETETIKPLYNIVIATAPDYDIDKILKSVSDFQKCC
ncbi:MAG: hypothetical protein ACI4D0_04620 [Lachnospira sp.]